MDEATYFALCHTVGSMGTGLLIAGLIIVIILIKERITNKRP